MSQGAAVCSKLIEFYFVSLQRIAPCVAVKASLCDDKCVVWCAHLARVAVKASVCT